MIDQVINRLVVLMGILTISEWSCTIMTLLTSKTALPIASLFSALSVIAISALPTKADIPMTISQAEEVFTLTVPDKDTTKSAYGGRLRRYDVHIAKMFEVTYKLCSDAANNSNINTESMSFL